jgi:hypothetical protein
MVYSLNVRKLKYAKLSMGVKFDLWHYEDIRLKVFALKRAEIIVDQSKLHYEDLRNFYSSPNILVTGMIKSNRMW